MPEYRHVVVLVGLALDDYFIVNAPLLLDRLHNEFLEDQGAPEVWTEFVKLSDPPQLTPVPKSLTQGILDPLSLTLNLQNERKNNLSTVDLPAILNIPVLNNLEVTDLVPLAAVILEYPIAYIPEIPNQTSFLANTQLDVYEYCLTLHGIRESPREHVLLKFSCPSSLNEGQLEQRPNRIEDKLRMRFSQRINSCNLLAEGIVKKHQATFDRVAL